MMFSFFLSVSLSNIFSNISVKYYQERGKTRNNREEQKKELEEEQREEQKLKEEEFCKRSGISKERNLPKKTLLFSSGRVFQRCFLCIY